MYGLGNLHRPSEDLDKVEYEQRELPFRFMAALSMGDGLLCHSRLLTDSKDSKFKAVGKM